MPSNNPTCPHCEGSTNKHGTTKTGKQRYRCKACKRSHTPGVVHGSEPVGDSAMTAKERQRKWYASLSDEQKQALNKKRNDARKRRKQKASEDE